MLKKENSSNVKIILIIVLSILFFMTFVGGITFAIYSRAISDMLGSKFAEPIEVVVVDDLNVPKGGGVTIPIENSVLLPGAWINMKFGFVMGKEGRTSSPAYIRVRLNITSDSSSDMGSTMDDGILEFGTTNNPFSAIEEGWVEADFGQDGKWWVFSENVDGTNLARVAVTGDSHTFIDGRVRIGRKLTNEFANKNIYIEYVVDAIQSKNVENPILDINNPTWGKLIEN